MKQQQNKYNVPTQQWNSFEDQGQQFFNQLYEKISSRKTTVLNEVSGTGNTSNPNQDQIVDRFILETCVEATLLYNQLQPHED